MPFDFSFKKWILEEKLFGSGTKITATGLNAGGQAQSGMRYRPSIKPSRPHKIKKN